MYSDFQRISGFSILLKEELIKATEKTKLKTASMSLMKKKWIVSCDLSLNLTMFKDVKKNYTYSKYGKR